MKEEKTLDGGPYIYMFCFLIWIQKFHEYAAKHFIFQRLQIFFAIKTASYRRQLAEERSAMSIQKDD